MMTEECEKDIKEYLEKNNYDSNGHLLCDKRLSRTCFVCSKKGYEKNLFKKYIVTGKYIEIDKWFLNYISPVLIKHKITQINIVDSIYESKTWKFDEIKKIN